ncbi:MAG: aspartyl protease family protein [Pyrinomonadaceae bacterium]
MFQLNFDKFLSYDTGEIGINLNVALKLTGKNVDLIAKIDTGATHCLFERKFGEQLGLDIETGIPQKFSTATGIFLAYGHNITLITENLEFDSYVFFYADESHKPNVLGRFGWLDRIILGLVDYEGKLFLNYYEQNYG